MAALNQPEETTNIGIPIIEDLAGGDRVIQLSEDDRKIISALPTDSALLISIGQGQDQLRFLLDNNLTTVGRKEKNDIFLDDITVSRIHAEFIRQNESFSVRDCSSLNGTYVNGAQVDEQVLSSSDIVQIGKYRFLFVSKESF
ncbi:MAG: FHA domain-containing protein [Bifidobacteriaceae bacterium]|jgi:pSer/pThr/pTyr-binding forkhead associated (FHA) protein|nr:FHA domain-containing protein [Bifidobacteriaceae bacterium]